MSHENQPVPLDHSLWPTDLSQLHGNLLVALYAAAELLDFASVTGNEESLCNSGVALAQALKPLGEMLRPFLSELQAAHERSLTALPPFAHATAYSMSELIQSIISHVVGMFLLPADNTPGPVHWHVRIVLTKERSEHTEKVRERLRTVERFNVSELRRLVDNEIGLAARLRLAPGAQPDAALDPNFADLLRRAREASNEEERKNLVRQAYDLARKENYDAEPPPSCPNAIADLRRACVLHLRVLEILEIQPWFWPHAIIAAPFDPWWQFMRDLYQSKKVNRKPPLKPNFITAGTFGSHLPVLEPARQAARTIVEWCDSVTQAQASIPVPGNSPITAAGFTEHGLLAVRPPAHAEQHEGAGSMPVQSMTTEKPHYTLGQLISDLEGSERAYQDNIRTADMMEARDGNNISAYRQRIQAAVLCFHADPARQPGIDRIEGLCDVWGTGLNAENVRKLRGTVCSKLGVGVTEANAMTLDSVATTLGLAVSGAKADDGVSSSMAGKAARMIKVLLLSANPIDAPLSIEEEFRAIDARIRASDHRDHVQLISHGAVRLEDIPGLLMRHKPHVVHFSGHGDSGAIELTTADGPSQLVPPDTLANIFRVLKDNVRVVVLNSCHSEPQAQAIVSVIDCAVGMSEEIEDRAAIAFSAAFYEALGYGRSVQDAFELGLVQLSAAGGDQALTKLHKRRGAKPAEIILVTPPRP